MIEIVILFLFPWAMGYAAASDLFTMTISNRISLVLVAGFLVLAPLTGMDLNTFGLHLAAGAVMLAVTFGFFAMGWIGGGDAKLAAAISLWLGWSATLTFSLVATLIGGLLTFAILMIRSDQAQILLPGWSWVTRLQRHGGGVPYGIALALTGLGMYPQSPWMQWLLNGVSL